MSAAEMVLAAELDSAPRRRTLLEEALNDEAMTYHRIRTKEQS